MIRRYTLFAALAALVWSATAHANGRFPKSTNVFLQPGNPQTILLGVTFGLLISRDGGASFQWICEEAIGYGGTFDPDYAVAADGVIFATTFEGLRVTRDGGCTWETAGELSPDDYFEEVEIGPDGTVWAATASDMNPNHVYQSTDSGMTFTPMDSGLPNVWWKSLRVAPSDPQRLYVTGYRVNQAMADGGAPMPTAVAYRTVDGGQNWTALDLSTIQFGNVPWVFVEVVANDNPDVLYVRSQGAEGAIGDVLYRSTDSGDTWTEILRTDVAMQAVLMRQNGTLMVGTLTSGVHRSVNGGDTWEMDSLPQMCCLGESGDGTLFSCGANWDPDFFALGRSMDGQSWDKVVRFSEVKTAYSCPTGTIQRDTCESKRWPSLCEMFGCNGTVDASPTPDGPVIDNGKRGCCQVGGQTPWDSLVLGMAIGLLLWRRRRNDLG